MYCLTRLGEYKMIRFNDSIRIRKIGTRAFLVDISSNKIISMSIKAVDFLQNAIRDGTVDKLDGDAKIFIDNLIASGVLNEVK